MNTTSIDLSLLMNHLNNVPRDFLEIPDSHSANGAPVNAVFMDAMEIFGLNQPLNTLIELLPINPSESYSRFILLTSWFISSSELKKIEIDPDYFRAWIKDDLLNFSKYVSVDKVLSDEERTEEYVRRALQILGARPEGESEDEFEHRLSAIDSLARHGLMRNLRGKIAHARQLREKMAAKKAQEAAARAGREW